MLSETIRVLQVVGIMDRGGAETLIMNLYRHFDRERIQFDFVVHSMKPGAYDKEIEALGGIVYHCPRYTGCNHIPYIRWWKSFFRLHPEYRILHCHIRSVASLIIPIAKQTGLTCIVHSHSTRNGRGLFSLVKTVYQFPLRFQADYFMACSKESGAWLFGKRIVNGPRYYGVRNAIDVNSFSFDEKIRREIRNKFGIAENSLVVMTVGRMTEAKNIDGILDIYRKVIEKRPLGTTTKLLWVGDGEKREHIEKRIRNEALTGEIVLTGIRPDVNRLLMAADVFILPSFWEGLPVVAVEAQASGLPCLLSDRITKEVAVSPLVQYLSIGEGYDIWAEKILKMWKKRSDVSEYLIGAGFDVQSSASWLQMFYSGLSSRDRLDRTNQEEHTFFGK